MNRLVVFATLLFTMGSVTAEERVVWMDTLDLSAIHQDWGKAQPKLSMRNKPLALAGKVYEHGVGSHASAAIYVALDGKATRFQATVGVDDNAGDHGTVTLQIYGADALLLESGVLRGGGEPFPVDLDITGQTRITIVLGDGGDGVDYDHVDLADACFLLEGETPRIVRAPEEPKIMRTPTPPDTPRINGPLVYGVRPGSPFLYRIPATGLRPMTFSIDELPEGLKLDEETGILSGAISELAPKAHDLILHAKNDAGEAERALRIVVGDTLALTPPMGWNHWYAHYDRITDAMVRRAADIMVESGMADVGYQYVNIDDCWANREEHADPKRVGPFRDDAGNIIPNAYFPDMHALTDYIHAKGLKAGLYTSPGPKTCAGFAGTWHHEEQDAQQFADWGFDFLKYDWCSYNDIAADRSLPELKKPYIRMGNILKSLDRDIILNLCQYGMGDVWEWGEEVGGQCWRTAGDLGFELTRYHDVAQRNSEHRAFAHPGAWNDPDYLLIGYVGDARGMGEPVPCPLTPSEQYSYMSLWCLMAAPLFYSGDMERLDAFTLNVLCNPEVIAINQDPLGVGGYPKIARTDSEVWVKPLAGGAWAVGLFNRAEITQPISVTPAELGLEGTYRMRDCWRQQDLGELGDAFETTLGRHDVMLLRLEPAQ